VRELLLAGRRATREVILADDVDPAPILDEIIDLADENNVEVREIGRSKFEAMARTEAPQGVMAKAQPLPDLELEDVVATPDGSPPFLLILDGITDPGNLGALLRTGECAGVTGVVLPRHRAARITPTVTKAAAGAIEHLPIATVTGIPKALGDLVAHGVWSVGLDVVADTDVYNMNVADGPVALVLGAEGRGLSRLARDRCDLVVTIPLKGVLGSLNVSAAAAVACFEVARTRGR
jgi:23S rRNA (guanosine2251-2'-O)-methyltransferase